VKEEEVVDGIVTVLYKWKQKQLCVRN